MAIGKLAPQHDPSTAKEDRFAATAITELANAHPYPTRPAPAVRGAGALSAEAKRAGIRAYARFSFMNGLGFPFFSGSVIVLLAMHFNPSNTTLAVIGSMQFILSFVQVLANRLLGGKDLVYSAGTLWMVRGLVFTLIFLTPWVGAHLGNPLALALILLTYGFFCAAKMTASVTFPSIIYGLSDPNNRGATNARAQTLNHVTAIVAGIVAFAIRRYGVFGGRNDLFLLIGLGILLNTAAGWLLRSVPYREVVVSRGVLAVFQEFTRQFKQRALRNTLLLSSLITTQTILIAFTINYLKKILHYADEQILIYQVITFVGYMLGNLAAVRWSDRLGTRRLFTLANALVLGLALVWAVLPAGIPSMLVWLLGLGSYSSNMLLSMALARLVLRQAPEGDKIAYQGALTLASTVTGTAIGTLGGRLCDLAERAPHLLGPLNIYGPAFLLLALAALLALLLGRAHPDPN